MSRIAVLGLALLALPAAAAQLDLGTAGADVPGLPDLQGDPVGDPLQNDQSPDTPQLPTPGAGGDDGVDWSSGLVWGIGLGGAGLIAAAGLAYYLGVGGLRHIDKENVLDHPMRQSLLGVVETEPGVHLRELAQRHDTAVTNTQWHLRKLEMAGLVKTQKVQGRRLYYPTRGGAAVREQAVQNATMQNPNARRILGFLEGHPGTNQRTLADNLGMNPGTVRWHLRKMESANMVRCVQDGTQTCYFPVSQGVGGAWATGSGREGIAVEDR